jgi:hypothetical protein
VTKGCGISFLHLIPEDAVNRSLLALPVKPPILPVKWYGSPYIYSGKGKICWVEMDTEGPPNPATPTMAITLDLPLSGGWCVLLCQSTWSDASSKSFSRESPSNGCEEDIPGYYVDVSTQDVIRYCLHVYSIAKLCYSQELEHLERRHGCMGLDGYYQRRVLWPYSTLWMPVLSINILVFTIINFKGIIFEISGMGLVVQSTSLLN